MKTLSPSDYSLPRFTLWVGAFFCFLSTPLLADVASPPAGSYIQNRQTRQIGAKLNLSSGTIDNLRTSSITFAGDGSVQTTAGAGGLSYVRSGWSSRFSESVSVITAAAALDQILGLSYLSPTVSLSGSPSNSVRENGAAVASIVFSAFTVKRSSPITSVSFSRTGTGVFATIGSPNPNGGTEQTTYNIAISSNATFSATVTDGGSTGNSNSYTYTFVYPFYYGVGAQALTGAQVQALTKLVQTQQNTATTTSPSSQVYYFAYPQSYGALTSILDPNQFETISGYTQRTASLTMLDTTSVSYYIYEFNSPTTQTNFTNTYKF